MALNHKAAGSSPAFGSDDLENIHIYKTKLNNPSRGSSIGKVDITG